MITQIDDRTSLEITAANFLILRYQHENHQVSVMCKTPDFERAYSFLIDNAPTKRKVIQIFPMQNSLTALFDDGTVWVRNFGIDHKDGLWVRIPTPQD